jgi:hypothetical protein
MRKRFDKSPAIDAASNLRLVTTIQNSEEPYTEAEEELLRNGEAKFALFGGNAKTKKAKSPTPTVKNEISFKEGDHLGWGRSETLVRARKEEILAYLWDTAARCRWSASDMERTVLVTKNDHHYIGYVRKRNSSHFILASLAPRSKPSFAIAGTSASVARTARASSCCREMGLSILSGGRLGRTRSCLSESQRRIRCARS